MTSPLSDSAESSQQGLVIAAFLVVTVQLIRCAMDLIQVASKVQKRESIRLENKPSPSVLDNNNNNGGVDKPTNSPPKLPRHGSYGSSGQHAHTDLSNSERMKSATASEREPLLSLSTLDDETTDLEKEEAKYLRRQKIVRRVFSCAWLILAGVFGAIGVRAALMKYHHFINSERQSFSGPPSMVLLLSSLSLLLEAWLLFRDSEKERYGSFQRFFQLAASLLFWLIFAIPTLATSSQSHLVSWTLTNIILLVCATIVVLLSVTDGFFTKRLILPPSLSALEELKMQRHKQRLSSKAIFILLKPYFWPDGSYGSAFWNRVRAISTWIFVILSKVASLYSPLLLGWATTALAHEQYGMCIRYSCLYSLISFLGTTLKEGQSLVYLKVAQAAFVQLAEAAFAHLHSLSLDWHLRKKLGEVLRSMDRGIAACDTLMKYLFLWLVPAIAECLVVCIIFATYFQYLPLALTVFYFVFLYVVWTILLTLWRKKFRKALVQSDNEYHDIFTDSMVNFETVKHFTAENFEKNRFVDAVSRYQAGSTSVQSSLSFLNISQQVILKCCLAVALSLAAWGIRQRAKCCIDVIGCDSPISQCCLDTSVETCPGMQVGDFVAVLTYTLNLFAPLNFLGSVYNAVVMAIVDLGSMSELLAENPDVLDAPDALELPPSNMTEPDIAVEFENVTFHYPTQPSSQGLKGLSFKMKRGTTTAIVGPTGAGKTTVSRLLFRFYDVLGGAVKVNGTDVRSLKQTSLRGAIGVVPQAASMFNDSMRYNLLYGNRGATQKELEQAAKDAQILNFIENLKEGWDTVVGDRGLKLSGGEKQRAAIARCLLKNPPFVLLDEATSALDTITEKSVQEALDRLGAHRTVLVIAHRLGTIRNADNIIVLKDGVAAEEGTHDELLARQGIYADMWNMQLHTSSASSSRNDVLGAISE